MSAPASLRFDMRAPSFSPASAEELYRCALDMSQWADERGLRAIGLSEHHGADDGFLPSPLVMAGMVVGRTRRISITVGALLVPLYDPTQLAEDLAVLDLASGGRVSIIAGLGYRPEEYALRGKDWNRRGQLFEEAIETILRVWAGEPIQREGMRIPVTPKPRTSPHPFIAVGGSSKRAAERAARLGLPFIPATMDPEVVAHYKAECARRAVKRAFAVVLDAPVTFVSNDPDRFWKELGPYFLYDATTYASWQRPESKHYWHTNAASVAALRDDGRYRILTPEECLAEIERLGERGELHFSPLVGGVPPTLGWQSLKLFEEKVLPYLGPPQRSVAG